MLRKTRMLSYVLHQHLLSSNPEGFQWFMGISKATVKVVGQDGIAQSLCVVAGTYLRQALLNGQLTPYQGIFREMNCRGLGLCGSCKVWMREGEQFWERRSCQIRCFGEMEIRLSENHE